MHIYFTKFIRFVLNYIIDYFAKTAFWTALLISCIFGLKGNVSTPNNLYRALHNIGARLNQVIRCLFIVEQQQLMNRHAIGYKPIRDDFCTHNAIPSDIGKNATRLRLTGLRTLSAKDTFAFRPWRWDRDALMLHTGNWYSRPWISAPGSQDKALIESIQRRFTRMIPSIRKFSYEERLKKLGLWTLEDRRIRADLVEVYKMVLDCLQFIWTRFLNFHHLIAPEVILWNWRKTDFELNWDSERVINIWNKLDDDTVCAFSLNCFKHHIQKLYQDGSFHRLLQSLWPKRLSQFPLGRPCLVRYLVRYTIRLRVHIFVSL